MIKLMHHCGKSKFRCFLSGLLFAGITAAALIFCVMGIRSKNVSAPEIMLPFGIAILSMLVGVITMYGLERRSA